MNIAEIAPDDARLHDVFEVMKELRTHLSFEQFRKGYERALPQGYSVAAVFDDGQCRAVAGYRLMNNLVSGYHMYIDDLITGEQWRSHGYGRALNDYLVERARDAGCGSVQLDSATYRREAHRFYFRERYSIWSYHFVQPLKEGPAQ